MLKKPILRDRKYLNWLRTQPCIMTGLRSDDFETVDPMHIGTLGKGIKSPDNEALPVIHSLHAAAHQRSEVEMLRRSPPDVIRAAFRALARELYSQYKQEQENGKAE